MLIFFHLSRNRNSRSIIVKCQSNSVSKFYQQRVTNNGHQRKIIVKWILISKDISKLKHGTVSALITENHCEWRVFILFSQKRHIRVVINEDVQSVNCGLWRSFYTTQIPRLFFFPLTEIWYCDLRKSFHFLQLWSIHHTAKTKD